MRPFLKIIAIGLTFGILAMTKAQYRAPVAIIKDKDGFVNVREKPSVNSKILGKLYNNQVFEDMYLSGNNTKNWIYVSFKNKGSASGESDGYIYYDRVQYLEKLPQLKRKITDKNLTEFSGNGIIVKMQFGEFEKEKHKITTKNNFIYKIDGMELWGIDGQLHHDMREITTITVTQNGKTFSFPRSALANLYEPNAENTFVSVNGDTIFIQMSNSDAGEAYNVV